MAMTGPPISGGYAHLYSSTCGNSVGSFIHNRLTSKGIIKDSGNNTNLESLSTTSLELLLDDIMTDRAFLHRIKVIQNLGDILERIKATMKQNANANFITHDDAAKIIHDMMGTKWFQRASEAQSTKKLTKVRRKTRTSEPSGASQVKKSISRSLGVGSLGSGTFNYSSPVSSRAVSGVKGLHILKECNRALDQLFARRQGTGVRALTSRQFPLPWKSRRSSPLPFSPVTYRDNRSFRLRTEYQSKQSLKTSSTSIVSPAFTPITSSRTSSVRSLNKNKGPHEETRYADKYDNYTRRKTQDAVISASNMSLKQKRGKSEHFYGDNNQTTTSAPTSPRTYSLRSATTSIRLASRKSKTKAVAATVAVKPIISTVSTSDESPGNIRTESTTDSSTDDQEVSGHNKRRLSTQIAANKLNGNVLKGHLTWSPQIVSLHKNGTDADNANNNNNNNVNLQTKDNDDEQKEEKEREQSPPMDADDSFCESKEIHQLVEEIMKFKLHAIAQEQSKRASEFTLVTSPQTSCSLEVSSNSESKPTKSSSEILLPLPEVSTHELESKTSSKETSRSASRERRNSLFPFQSSDISEDTPGVVGFQEIIHRKLLLACAGLSQAAVTVIEEGPKYDDSDTDTNASHTSKMSLKYYTARECESAKTSGSEYMDVEPSESFDDIFEKFSHSHHYNKPASKSRSQPESSRNLTLPLRTNRYSNSQGSSRNASQTNINDEAPHRNALVKTWKETLHMAADKLADDIMATMVSEFAGLLIPSGR